MIATRRLKVNRFLSRPASSFATQFNESVGSLPMREAMRYKEKNMQWTANDFNKYSNNHASALLDLNFKAGETMVLWMPEGPEKHVTMVAAAKMGMKIVDVDHEITDVAEIRKFLAAAKCKVIFFKQVHEDADYLLLLRKSIPEFFEYVDSHGQMFYSKHYPDLRYFVHTGFDLENGALNYKSLFLPNPTKDLLGDAIAAGSDAAPLYQQITKDGKVGPEHTAAKILDHPSWWFAKNIVNREFFEHDS
mmetsp:Transcript_54538/g.111264  ORF Transcript_54538/g.111264 Transcript_54538/m.111264 type:complete len:248 (+) Transcript_54538:2-745(+)